MVEWETLLWVFFGVVMAVVVLGGIGAVGYMRKENGRYTAEARRWAVLAHTGQPAEAVVSNVRMHPNNMTRGGSRGQTVCALVLDVAYTDAAGAAHSASIPTFVEDALVPQFLTPQRVVHLRYDPSDPASVAIDRTRTPLELPRAD